MTTLKVCISLFALATLVSCSNNELTLDQIVHTSIAFEKQAMNLDSTKFALMIPKDWIRGVLYGSSKQSGFSTGVS